MHHASTSWRKVQRSCGISEDPGDQFMPFRAAAVLVPGDKSNNYRTIHIFCRRSLQASIHQRKPGIRGGAISAPYVRTTEYHESRENPMPRKPSYAELQRRIGGAGSQRKIEREHRSERMPKRRDVHEGRAALPGPGREFTHRHLYCPG